ncbi:hypothetical protein DFQ27_001436 [Actinomortierella ambigua]|uniref:Uncharacterized protein n=1 Tax=Actinomortierella ambigua TaxID=1343610 RepID=A0A9P6TV51_9FUNG|nr:hypothetical protein DFQ27_001436 [Actinomortierella ambigua]
MFTVQHARRTIQQHDLKALVEEQRLSPPKAKYKRAPILANMDLLNRWRNPDGSVISERPYPPSWWKMVFERMHSKYRYNVEKNFLYLFSHNAIITNGLLARWKPSRNFVPPSPDCRRCRNDRPQEPPGYESKEHAFFACPSLLPIWALARQWIETICRIDKLSEDRHENILCWPSRRVLPPLAIHIHSAVSHAIRRTFLELNDGDKIYADSTQQLAFHLLRQRATVEMERARQRDESDQHRTGRGPVVPNRASHVDVFLSEWHHPGAIEIDMSKREGNNIVFAGHLWPRPREPAVEEMALDQADRPRTEEPGEVGMADAT